MVLVLLVSVLGGVVVGFDMVRLIYIESKNAAQSSTLSYVVAPWVKCIVLKLLLLASSILRAPKAFRFSSRDYIQLI